ncbi:MAG: NAD(P)(+) transhydrogenase (Re/Si-specific) subunit beta [Candidatus Manganitrophus sp.]|nr:MAG: NAD(P)(+) transhydrogenase (Re/Si-specific) subunit beta [Candidatus Manganitrophus sp.]
MPQCDVCLVVGANDVVNPAARADKSSPIFGMPIIDADKARRPSSPSSAARTPASPASTTSFFYRPNTLDALRRRQERWRRSRQRSRNSCKNLENNRTVTMAAKAAIVVFPAVPPPYTRRCKGK